MDGETILRGAQFFVGLLALVIGVVLVAQPDLAATIPFGTGVLGAVGVVAVLSGLFIARDRWQTRVGGIRSPIPEFSISIPSPGSSFDDMIVQLTEERRGTIEYRERIAERLEQVALAALMYQQNCSMDEAMEQLESGSWTDNSVAAAYFAGGTVASNGSGLRGMFGGDSSGNYTDVIEQTVKSIVQITEQEIAVSEEDDDREGVERLKGLILGSDAGDEEEEIQTAWYPEWYGDTGEAEHDRFFDLGAVSTNHWTGVTSIGLVTIGFGIFASIPSLMLAGGVALAYAPYAHYMSPTSAEQVRVERTVSDASCQPGDEIKVTVTVENVGNSLLADLRVIDVVPEAVLVVDGTARLGTALRPGQSDKFTYTARLERGDHCWPTYLSSRDIAGCHESIGYIRPDTEVRCLPSLRTPLDMPVRAQTSQYAGGVSTQTGGSGLEFFSVREYRPGDPMKRVNWKRLAKTGELGTVDYREEKAAMVTLLFDTREAAYLAERPGARHAVNRSVDAASEIFASLFDRGDLVGLAAFDTVPLWLGPGAGADQLERARLQLSNHPAMSPVPPSQKERAATQSGYIDPMTHVRRQLPQNCQIIMFSPLCDNYSSEVARRLDSAGHRVTIISPDPTGEGTMGEALARVERSMRINYLRERGIRIMDWQPDESLIVEMERARMGWATA